jgi:hypothetical protein
LTRPVSLSIRLNGCSSHSRYPYRPTQPRRSGEPVGGEPLYR